METKKCRSCGAEVAVGEASCPYCGTADFDISAKTEPINFEPEKAAEPEVKTPENVISGIVGAFLFSLAGVLLYFILYQLEYIAGIVGLVIFVLANFGYGLFSGTRKQGSLKGVIVSIIVMLVMIWVAEYICLGYIIYDNFKGQLDISFFDAMRAVPEAVRSAELAGDIAGELALAYILGIAASAATIFITVKAQKNK